MASVGMCSASHLNVVLPCYSTMGFLASLINVNHCDLSANWPSVEHCHTQFVRLNSPHWTTFASIFERLLFPSSYYLVDTVTSTSDVKPWCNWIVSSVVAKSACGLYCMQLSNDSFTPHAHVSCYALWWYLLMVTMLFISHMITHRHTELLLLTSA